MVMTSQPINQLRLSQACNHRLAVLITMIRDCGQVRNGEI